MDGSTMLLLLCAVAATLMGLVNGTSYCGDAGADTPYNMEDSICCGKKLQPRGVNSRCCEATKEVYNAGTQVCCGTVHDVQRPWTVGCCEDGNKATLYNTSRQECCLGNIHDTKKQITLKNGGITEYDIQGFCCGPNYVERTYDGEYKACCYNDKDRALSTPYNLSQSRCCAGRVQPLINNEQCCGQLTYDADDQVCCFPNDVATIFPAIGNGQNKCCAKATGGVISLATHVCINEKPYERECFPHAYGVESSTKGCCAGFNFNKTTHHCCGERVLPRDTECCSGQPVLAGQVCCGPDHGIQTLSHPTHNTCCITAASWTTYDNSTSTCHYGVVSQRVMCGGRVYNPDEKACCGGVLSGTGCCAGRAILAGQVCCGPDHGVVNVSNAGEDSCCYTASTHRTYDTSTHKCRHGMVKARLTCRGKPFNPARELCCMGDLYPKMYGYMCCGKRIYTPKYFTCCDGRRMQGANRSCH